jgi:neutral amino acid transport system permease protein
VTSYLLYLASLVGIYTLFSWGLNLQWGSAGLLNFGHAAFMIVGAYTTVLLNLRGFPLLLAVLGGMLAGAIVGGLMGMATLRLRQDYLGIVTIGFAEALRIMALNEAWLTQGSQGLVGFDRPLQSMDFEPNLLLRLALMILWTTLSIGVLRGLIRWGKSSSRGTRRWRWSIAIGLGGLALGLYCATTYALYYYTWVPGYRRSGLLLLLCLCLAGIHWGMTTLLASPWGRIVQGIREDEEVITAVGKNVFRYKLQVLMLGGAIAALAGAFYSWHLGSVFPDHFKPQLTFDAWTIVILGGAGHPLGPLLGALLFWGYESLSRFMFVGWGDARLEALRLLGVGVILILLMRWRPQGLLGTDEP